MQRLAKKFDVVVYGATGFTGNFVVEEVAKFAQRSGKQLSWAVAGRSPTKLKDALKFAEKETGINLSKVEVLSADSSQTDTLHAMTKQSQVVINCVGPYHKFGEPVVKSCIENNADHVDISGEPQFLDGMKLKYDEDAKSAGVHIVGACGYDSVPADVGLCYMMKNFKGTLNSAECYVKTQGGKGASIHTGTMESAALAIANRELIGKIRKQLYPTRLPKPKFKKEVRGSIHQNTDVNLYAIPLPTDEPMVNRTQRYFYESRGYNPVQFQGFLGLKTWGQSVGTLIGAMYFVMLSYFSWMRNLLIKYPEVMTAGVFSKAGPSRDQLKNMKFISSIVGKGWSQPVDVNKDGLSAPDAKAMVKVIGPDPGYRGTAAMLVTCAMTLLLEKDKCSEKGGVMSPGMAFYDTSIYDRLIEAGIKLEYEDK